MSSNNPQTREWQALSSDHHLAPFSDFKQLKEKGPRIITNAKGVYLWDSEGNKILDGMAGLWCVAIGYGRDELAEAASKQMRELPYYNLFFQTAHPPALQLAKAISEIAPEGMNHVFFTGSGSEGNDTVLRMVRHYWAVKGKPAKKVIISRINGYHGSTVAGASLGGMTYMHEQGDLPIPGIVHIPQPYWFGEGGDMTPDEFGVWAAEQLEKKILELGEENVGAFIAEPIQGAGGVIVPPANYWPLVREVCDKYGVLLIADEVVTGFGRSGNMFGVRGWGVAADIQCFAKGINSGYVPLGATVVNQRVADAIESCQTFSGAVMHGYTYSGHPVACAAALASLKIVQKENLPENAGIQGANLLEQLQGALSEFPSVGEVRGKGLMIAIDLVKDKATREPIDPMEGFANAVAAVALREGVIVRPVGTKIILSPPLTIGADEVEKLTKALRKGFEETPA